MYCVLTIVRYPKYFAWAGFLSMALFRIFLFLNKKISFWKLMGCGKNGTFDKTPDWRQWALLAAFETDYSIASDKVALQNQLPNFINKYWQIFHCEKVHFILEPIEGHGTWDGKACFGVLPKHTEYEGVIAVLTRATIRLNRLKNFWGNVDTVANQMAGAKGFIISYGIGEVPFIKQATFSIWQSKEQMKAFAYSMKEHREVIQKTRKESWYSEEMFTRFKVLQCYGMINSKNPLEGIH
jgi:heme-degrading monooxygenase HmoA